MASKMCSKSFALNGLIRKVFNPIYIPLRNSHPSAGGDAWRLHAIGCREIVGHGQNSDCSYVDSPGFPYPAIRWMEPSPEILALREREKGDWRSLSIEEKKCLYRTSYCQTYAEMLAPTGTWKTIIGKGLILISVGIWAHMLLQWMFAMELPESFNEECQKAQLKRILILEMNPITGLCSQWDYQNKKWK